jgi:hypothetical protein
MRMMIKKIALLIHLILISGIASAQDDDFGLWFGVDAKHEILKNLDVEFSGALRTFNNSSQIDETFLEAGLKYNFNKHISLSGSYRLTNKLEDDTKYYFRHKIFFGLKADIPLGYFLFSGRAMIQRTTKTYIENEEDLSAFYYGRLKLKAEYDFPSFPLSPFIYYEPFIPIFSDSGFKIDRNRFSSGAELQITDKSSIKIEYIYQRDFQPHIADENIISLTYKIEF